jgi:hypothetical protein
VPVRFARLERVLAVIAPAYAVRRARARRALAADRIAAELAGLEARRPRPPRRNPWRPYDVDVVQGFRIPRR